MKYMQHLLFATALLLLAGCDFDHAENAKTFASGGTVVGTLNDGRVVRCYEIDTGYHAHYLYVTDGATTNNYQAQSGKTSRPVTTGHID